MRQKKEEQSEKTGLKAEHIQQILNLSQSIKYGTITLVFQDGVLVQIDRNEKIRL